MSQGSRASVPVLEVRQLWGDLVLDTRHFRPSAERVRVGDRLGWRWELLGVDMGFVPEPLHRVLPWLPPIWSEVHMDARTDFTTGEAALSGAEEHPLFAYDEDSGWRAQPPGADAVPIGSEPVELALGETVFQARVVDAARRTERAGAAPDSAMAGSLGMMAGIGLCFGLLVATAPPPAEVSILDEDHHEMVAMLRVPPEPPEKRTPEVVEEAPEPEPEHARATTGRDTRDTSRKRGGHRGLGEAEQREARQAGIFSSGGLDRLLGSDAALDSTLLAASSKLFAKGDGGAGLGISGLGDRAGWLGDGGGDDEGIGGIDVFGDGGPPGPGSDGLGDGDKTFGAISRVGGDPILIVNLSAEQVDRVVKRHLAAIRYCYQRELTKDHDLAGKLTVKFTIAEDGTVSSAKARADTLGSAAVEQCVVGRFLRMQFPEPSGGGIAIVSYPFVFQPG